jgi:Tfp pilus assembly protein PilF/NADH:ubiquinone oxidoreductase subunit 6 (subunit J)
MDRIAFTHRYRLLVWAVAVLFVNSVILFLFDHRHTPPRTEFEGFFYLLNVLLHLVLGLVLAVVFLFLGRMLLKGARERMRGALVWLTLVVCFISGVYLLIVGNLAPQRTVLLTHIAAAILSLLAGMLYIRLLARQEGVRGEIQRLWRTGRWVGGVVLLVPLVFVGLTAIRKTPEATIENPRWAPMSPLEEGDGSRGPFFPSSAQTKHKGFFPSEYFTDSQSCGVSGCHPDIYRQWFTSSHHFSSFNNQWYRKSIEYMQEVIGTRPSKWCGGCHDMAILLTEMPGTGGSRMDVPIKDQVWPPETFPEAHAGIGCAVCHSIVAVKSTMGQGDYLADYPPMHKYAITQNRVLKAAHNFLIRRAPEPHKKTFLKPFHTQEPANFCSACHKVHLDAPVNNFRWFRGFNEYDAWQVSGVSGFGARAFYYPSDPKTGQPAFKRCIDCHMPAVPSSDAGAHRGEQGSWVHSHRFPGANTALPFSHGWDGTSWTGGSKTMLTATDDENYREQFEATTSLLRGQPGDPAVTVDVFALRREKPTGRGQQEGRGEPQRQLTTGVSEPPKAASMFGSEEMGGVKGVATQMVEEEVIAPLNTAGAVVRRGESVLIDVVVRTRKVGHAFPGGTIDAFDAWLEMKAVDDRGNVLLWSGDLEFPDGPVDRWAHFYRGFLLDAHGNPINKRNAWAARVALYSRRIPPGAADVAHFRLHIPNDCGDTITITTRLNYRKFHWYNTQFAFAGRPLGEEEGKEWVKKRGRVGLGFIEEEGRGGGGEGWESGRVGEWPPLVPSPAWENGRVGEESRGRQEVAHFHRSHRPTGSVPALIRPFAHSSGERGGGDYGKDGRLHLIGAGHTNEDGLLTPHWDDRQWVFDADTERVSALVKAVPKLPIIVIAEDSVTLSVVDTTFLTPNRPLDVIRDRGRWNDYGIGLYLQGDFRHALQAFNRVIQIDPNWPEGWVNIGRVRLDEGNLTEAEKALERALNRYGQQDTPMTPYLRARTLFFYGRVLKDTARLTQAEKVFREVMETFPKDREVHNQLGRVLFVQGKFKEAIQQFEQTLSIDPEDVAAHYNLSLCFKGVGDMEKARRHEKLYYRFKADETQTQIQGPYVLNNPWDNNEAQMVHEHGGRR